MKTISVLSGVFLTLCAGLMLLGVGGDYATSRDAAEWPTVDGRVLDSTLRVKGSRKNRFSAHVEYEYVVQGNRYQGDRLAIGSRGWSKDASLVQQTIAKYDPHRAVKVYYDPDSPSESTLEPRLANPNTLTSVAAFGGVMALLGVYLIRRGVPRRRPARRTAGENHFASSPGNSATQQEGVQLQTAALTNSALGRTHFLGKVGGRDYQVFAFDKGLMFLDLGNVQAQEGGDPGQTCALVGAVCGGMVGAQIGRLMDQAAAAPSGYRRTTEYNSYSDDELIDLAKQRRRSFVVRYEDIKTAAIEGPDFLERLCNGKNLQGYFTLREKTVGRVRLKILDVESMAEAIETCSKRFGDRLSVNAEYDRRQRKYVLN